MAYDSYKSLMLERFRRNQNQPHKQLTKSSDNQTVILKHLKIAIHPGILSAFGATIHSLSKKYGNMYSISLVP